MIFRLPSQYSTVDVSPFIGVSLHDHTNRLVSVNLARNPDGSYSVVFTPELEGSHLLHVRMFGIQVAGRVVVFPCVLCAVQFKLHDTLVIKGVQNNQE